MTTFIMHFHHLHWHYSLSVRTLVMFAESQWQHCPIEFLALGRMGTLSPLGGSRRSLCTRLGGDPWLPTESPVHMPATGSLNSVTHTTIPSIFSVRIYYPSVSVCLAVPGECSVLDTRTGRYPLATRGSLQLRFSQFAWGPCSQLTSLKQHYQSFSFIQMQYARSLIKSCMLNQSPPVSH